MPAILNPSPVAFVPRQIMLEKHADEFPAVGKATKKKEKKKQKKSSPETMELVRSDDDLLTLRKEKARKVLLRSIAAYLERSGFSKALSALRAEAQLEADDPKAYHLELDEVTLSVLESSDYDTKCSIGWAEEQGSERSGVVKRDQEDNVHKSEGKIMLEDSPVEIKDKRRKKKSISDSSEENAQEVPKKAGCGTHEEPVMKSNVAGKDKKKRKHKMAIDQVDENTAIMDHGIIQDICKEKMEVSNEKNRDEKRKKRKEASNSIVENGGGNIDSVVVQASVQNPSEDVDAKKDKKKKRDKPTLTASEEVVGGTSCKGAREHVTEEKGDSRNSDSQQLNGLVLDGRIGGIEKKVSKKRKRISYGETGLQDDNGTVVAESRQEKVDSVEEDKESETVQKVDTSLPGGAHKKMKIEKEKDNTNGFLEKSPGDPLNLSVTKDDNATPDQKKETENELVNGNIVNSLKEDGSSANAIKKGKHSAEPKTALAFQRVKIDEVKFADARLKDNSYWAKGGADAGYGAKAQEVLGQVRGRDFRHEKTKKKRGSYRGGQIDLQSHSIKFNYSDDE